MNNTPLNEKVSEYLRLSAAIETLTAQKYALANEIVPVVMANPDVYPNFVAMSVAGRGVRVISGDSLTLNENFQPIGAVADAIRNIQRATIEKKPMALMTAASMSRIVPQIPENIGADKPYVMKKRAPYLLEL